MMLRVSPLPGPLPQSAYAKASADTAGEGNKKKNRGFTLLELSIVLLVLSLVISGVLSAIQQDSRRSKRAETLKKMDAIEAELLAFAQQNGRLPCPADGTRAITDQYFGIEGATPGTCTGGTPAANFTDASNTVGGVVPIKTLGLADEYAFDQWGGRFFYAVDKRVTNAAAFTTYSVTSVTLGNSMTVKDSTTGNTKTSTAVVVILSYGPDGHGAYQLAASAIKSAGSTNVNEQKNCHCDAAAAPTAFDATFIQAPPTAIANAADPLDIFDDIVRYYTRASFLTAADTYSR